MKRFLLVAIAIVLTINVFAFWPFTSNNENVWTEKETKRALDLKEYNRELNNGKKEVFDIQEKEDHVLCSRNLHITTDMYTNGRTSHFDGLDGTKEIKFYGDKKTAEAIFSAFDNDMEYLRTDHIDFFTLSEIVDKVKKEVDSGITTGTGIGYKWFKSLQENSIEIYLNDTHSARIDIESGQVLYMYYNALEHTKASHFNYRNIRIVQFFVRDFNDTYIQIERIYMKNKLLAEKTIKSDSTEFYFDKYGSIRLKKSEPIYEIDSNIQF